MPYSHPQPISREQALRGLRHLLPGAAMLAGTAGFVNSVVLGFFHTPVSHMTGAVSRFGIDIAEGRARDTLASASIILGFVFGAIVAGVVVGAWKLIPGKSYGITLIIQGVLLGIATYLLLSRQRWALPVVAMSCGLQNAMTSSYCGLIIRTTHVTGMVTDLGVMIGHWLRHRQVEFWKMRFLGGVFLAFGLGGVLGAVADVRFGPLCLIVPAMGCVIAGTIFWFANHAGLVELMQSATPHPPKTGAFSENRLIQ